MTKTLYSKIFVGNQLELQNFGYFSSPRGNIGQDWHSDLDLPKTQRKNLNPCKLITVLICVTNQTFVCF